MIIAAWAGPKPGKNDVILPTITLEEIALTVSFLSNSILEICCLGIFTLSLRLIIKLLIPKSPDKSGNNS